MISLRNFFKTENNINPDKKQTEKKAGSVLDLFEQDFRDTPDSSFTECQLRLNNEREIIQTFKKKLHYKEYGIFDMVEIKIADRERKYVILKTYSPENIKIKNLKKLVDDLFQIYGKDDSNKSEFTELDKREYYNRQIYEFFGRTWLDPVIHKYPAMLSRTNEKLSLTIWGIELEKTDWNAVTEAGYVQMR